MSIRNTIRGLMRRYVLEHLPKPIRNIIPRNDDIITQREITNKSSENRFYYALTRHIDLVNITDKQEKDISKGKEEYIIEDSDFQKLISSLNNKIKQTNSSEPGNVLNNIYEQLTQIVLYLYSDPHSIIANSLNDKKTYTSMDSYVYQVIEQIIDSVDDKNLNVTPKYIEEYMDFIFKHYLNFHSLEELRNALVQMAIVNNVDENSNDDNTQKSKDNLQLIIEFYKDLLESFKGNQISLKDLNDITQILKSMDNKRLQILIDSINSLNYKKNDTKEARKILAQIEQIAQFKVEDLEQICNKIKSGKLNTIQLQKLIDIIENEGNTPKRQIKNPKEYFETITNNRRYVYVAGIAAAFLASWLLFQTSRSNETTINHSKPETESVDDNTVENIEEEQEDTYSLFYPALYNETDENGNNTERLAYVAVSNKTKELSDSNTIFVFDENDNGNGSITFTKPITRVEKEKITFPITTEYAYSPEGIEIPLYGYNKTAFKAKNEIIIDDELTIPKGEIVPGFLVRNNKKQEVWIVYYDQKEKKVKINLADSSLFESDIIESKVSPEVQYIGQFSTSTNMPVSNGQYTILEGTTLDLYLSDSEVLYQSEKGLINAVSSREIPYVQEQLESIWEENPNLKTYAESLGIIYADTSITIGNEKDSIGEVEGEEEVVGGDDR